MKKKRSNKGDIVNKLQPVRRSGIALCIWVSIHVHFSTP
jgi:hypothetical protein